MSAVSRLASGSSISSSRGCASSARPIATRWRSPPDSVCGRRASSGRMPSRSTTSSKPIRRAAARRRPKRRLLVTDMCGNSRASWNTRPTRRRSGGSQMPARGVGQHRLADSDAALRRRQQPGDGGDHAGFAGARRAEQHRHARVPAPRRRHRGRDRQSGAPARRKGSSAEHGVEPPARPIRRRAARPAPVRWRPRRVRRRATSPPGTCNAA